MKRDLNKSIQEYKRRYWNNPSSVSCFYGSDIQQIYEMSFSDGVLDPYSLINKGLMAGFMIGYRKAVRDLKKKEGKTIRKSFTAKTSSPDSISHICDTCEKAFAAADQKSHDAECKACLLNHFIEGRC